MTPGGSPSRSHRVGVHALAVLAVLVCAAAAWWQWDRAHRTEVDAVPAGPVVALADLDPATTFSGMQVLLTGEFDTANEVLVDPRPRDGVDGAWVLTPLLPSPVPTGTDTNARESAAVAVVRGWIPRGTRPAAPPTGVVDVVGVLVADARRADLAVLAGDPPTLEVVDSGALAEHAGYAIRSGWYALQEMHPDRSDQPLPLQVAELPGAEVGVNWRNAAYAIQWVVFAGFVFAFWSRFRRAPVADPVEQEK